MRINFIQKRRSKKYSTPNIFDRELRLLLLDAIERIEISFEPNGQML